MQRSTSLLKSGETLSKSSAACVCRRPLAVVVERKGESFRVIRVRVVEVAAELDGAIVVIVVVGVGAYQLSEIEARRRTILSWAVCAGPTAELTAVAATTPRTNDVKAAAPRTRFSDGGESLVF